MSEFLTPVESLRLRAREHLDGGPITDAYESDRERVLGVLDTVLATEIVCFLRYAMHFHNAHGIDAAPVAAEFKEHADEELAHAMKVAARISQLGGVPDFSPTTLASRSHSDYVEGDGLRSMIEEDLVAERVAIQSYTEITRWLGDGDVTTRRLMEDILAAEETHADDVLGLLTHFPLMAADARTELPIRR